MTDRYELYRNGSKVFDSHPSVTPEPPKPVDPVKPPEPTKPAEPGANPFIEWRAQGLEIGYIQMWKRRGLTPEDMELAYAAGYPRPVPGSTMPSVTVGDRSGYTLNDGNGWLVYNPMNNDQPYTFYFAKSGTIRVFGVSGTEVTKVNGQNVIGGLDIPNQSGSIVITVESIGGYVAVQLTGW